MKPFRLPLMVASVLLSGAFALLARDLIYALIVVPLSYAAWQIGVIFNAVPQLIWWAILVCILVVVTAWQLIPDARSAARQAPTAGSSSGQVLLLANWLQRARGSNYFRWQVANRLGRVWRQISDSRDEPALDSTARAAVDFLKAGLEQSFVDFSSRANKTSGADGSPLDADPLDVVAFLETHLREQHIGNAEHL